MSHAHHISTPEEFAAELSRLRAEAAMTVREVSKATDIPPATLGGYFSGRHLPPPTQPQVLADVLHALGIVGPEDHEAWREALLRVRRTPGPRSRTAPYRGLEPFDLAHAEWFFGREQQVDELTADVERLREGSGARLLFVVGVSGAGKSSLLRAGVLARLARAGVAIAAFAPGMDPLGELDRATADLPDDGVLLVDQAEELFGWDDAARESFLERLLAGRWVVLLTLRADFYASALADPRLVEHLAARTRLVGAMPAGDLARAITEPAVRAGGSVQPELVELLQRDLAGRRTAADVDPGVLPLLSHALLGTWQRSKGGRLTVTDYLATGGIEGAIRQSAEDVYQALDGDARAAARRLFSTLVSVTDDGTPTRRRIDHAHLTDYDEHLEAAIDAFVRGRILTAGERTLEISHEALLEAWPRLRGWIEADRDDLRIRGRVQQSALAWDEHGREDSALLGGTLLELAQGLAGDPLAPLERSFVTASARHEEAAREAARRRQRRTELLLVALGVLALVTSVLAVVALGAKGEADRERAAASDARDNALSRQIAARSERVAEKDHAAALRLALAAYRVQPTVEARSALLTASAFPATTRLRNPAGPMRAVPSPDGKTLGVVAADGKVRFWDLATRAVVGTAEVGKAELYAAAWSPDGRAFAAGGGGGALRVFDVSDPAHPVAWQHQPRGPKTAVQGLAFDRAGAELAAATSDPGVLRWTVRGERLAPLPALGGFGGSVQGLAFARGGLLATASSDGKVRLWRGEQVLATLSVGAATNFVNAVDFTPDGRLLAAGAKDKRVRVWDVARPEQPRLVTDRLRGFSSWVNGVAFSPDGRRLAAAASGGVTRVWATGSWRLVDTIPAPSNNTAVSFAPDGRSLITSQLAGMAEVHALGSPVLQAYGDNIWTLDHAGAQLVVGVGAADPQVGLVTAAPDGSLEPHGGLVSAPAAGALDGSAAIAPDGRTITAGTATGKVVVWRRTGTSWRRAAVLDVATQLIEMTAFAPDGSFFAVSSDDGSVTLFDTGTGGTPRLRERLDAGAGAVGVAIDPTSTLVAVGTFNREVKAWRVGPGKARALPTLGGFDNYVTTTAFSPDGTVLAAAAADGTVRRWRVDGDRLTRLGRPLRGPVGTIFGLAFAPDGSTLAVAAQDGQVLLYTRPTSKRPTTWARLDLGVEAHAATIGDGWVAAAGAEGRVARWQVDLRALTHTICTLGGAEISRAEWAQYVPGAPYRKPC